MPPTSPPTVDLALTRTCPCLAARRRARAVTRHFDAYLRPHRLRSTQFSVLAMLAQRGPTGRGRLADGLGLERPLALTEAGRRALDAVPPAWKEALDRLDDRVGRSEQPDPAAPRRGPGRVARTRTRPSDRA